MQDMSEALESSLWPYGAERAIEQWIADGAQNGTMEYPVAPDVRERLLHLHPRLNGWLYFDQNSLSLVFAETDAFRQIKARRDAEHQDRIDAERKASGEQPVNVHHGVHIRTGCSRP